jgi:solute carrier family 13 (sodium-dependent dicarboxylate transporter), member 2/3/5
MLPSYALFLPFNTVGNVIYFASGYFSVMDLMKAALIFGLVAYAGWIVTALTWWRVIGLN